MADFFHGVKLVEISDGISQVQVSSSSVIGVIGTAPDAKDEDFPLNTPVLITGSRVEAAKLGEKGTLPEALDGILSQCSALVVVVRVAEEKDEVTDEESGETISEFDAEKTIANFVGAVGADGTYTGVNAFLATRSKLGVTPRILLAPDFSTTEVVQEMIKVAERLRAIIVADCPVEIDLGMEKLEMEMTFAEYDPELFKLFGLTNGSEFGFTVRGGLESGTEVVPVVINARGYFKEMDFDNWKPAEKATLKCSVACNYYKLNINNTDMIEIDPVNMVRNVNGSDQLAKLREALQI